MKKPFDKEILEIVVNQDFSFLCDTKLCQSIYEPLKKNIKGKIELFRNVIFSKSLIKSTWFILCKIYKDEIKLNKEISK